MTIEMLLSAIGALTLLMAGYIASCLKELTSSVQQLNVNMAVVISRQTNHETRIAYLEKK